VASPSSLATIIVLAVAVSLAACGGDDTTDEATEAAASEPATGHETAAAEETAGAFGAGTGGGSVTVDGVSYEFTGDTICQVFPDAAIQAVGPWVDDPEVEVRVSVTDADGGEVGGQVWVKGPNLDWQAEEGLADSMVTAVAVEGNTATGDAVFTDTAAGRSVPGQFEVTCPG
jgi:hypothetical protein